MAWSNWNECTQIERQQGLHRAESAGYHPASPDSERKAPQHAQSLLAPDFHFSGCDLAPPSALAQVPNPGVDRTPAAALGAAAEPAKPVIDTTKPPPPTDCRSGPAAAQLPARPGAGSQSTRRHGGATAANRGRGRPGHRLAQEGRGRRRAAGGRKADRIPGKGLGLCTSCPAGRSGTGGYQRVRQDLRDEPVVFQKRGCLPGQHARVRQRA